MATVHAAMMNEGVSRFPSAKNFYQHDTVHTSSRSTTRAGPRTHSRLTNLDKEITRTSTHDGCAAESSSGAQAPGT